MPLYQSLMLIYPLMVKQDSSKLVGIISSKKLKNWVEKCFIATADYKSYLDPNDKILGF